LAHLKLPTTWYTRVGDLEFLDYAPNLREISLRPPGDRGHSMEFPTSNMLAPKLRLFDRSKGLLPYFTAGQSSDVYFQGIGTPLWLRTTRSYCQMGIQAVAAPSRRSSYIILWIRIQKPAAWLLVRVFPDATPQEIRPRCVDPSTCFG
jgi:hypothetical protein